MEEGNGIIVAIIGVIAIILFLVFNPIRVIGAGEVGVVTRWGAVNRVVQPGINMKWPVAEHVEKMNTRTQKDQLDAEAASRDLQVVHSSIAVNYHLDGSEASRVYQEIGTDYQDKVLSPAIQDTFKSTTAQYTAEELITHREQVRLTAEKGLREKMKEYGIIIDNFNIVNFNFSDEFNKAIEAKQVAQQEVETAKQKLEKTKVEAEQAKAQAQGQADAQKALKDSGSLSPEYLNYLALTKWDGHLPTYTGGQIPFVNIK